ncbi:hypothetical protein [Candidatus Lucifugimonas marina]|uniref:Uncharacterized protein n=1 Tax=Candidatus Lucifugimonas marina TaxID=3038979 RepID=A0AAJ5ZKF4_9CHLR|nr:hypothetical protein [SAR202 cluster bacterium JH702]WFG35868.1 hypothetical protein GKN94_09225 [SAR202 cluster bacterium JH545]WFG39813.1 hypothetical protein GKO48_09335 [SAR202 cluster bacterium JH1073]
MLHFKSCPKCMNGSLYEHQGLDGPEKKCVNCAYTVYMSHSIDQHDATLAKLSA